MMECEASPKAGGGQSGERPRVEGPQDSKGKARTSRTLWAQSLRGAGTRPLENQRRNARRMVRRGTKEDENGVNRAVFPKNEEKGSNNPNNLFIIKYLT